MYRRVLVPTDGSPGSEKAVRSACDLAEKYDAALYAVSVVETGGSRIPFQGTELRSKLVERAEAALDEVRAEGEQWDVEVTTQVLEGRPHEQVLQFADQRDVDLIVMGTHGREGLDRVLIGSVTERVVRSAGVPVLTVSLADDEPAVRTTAQARSLARETLEARGYDDVVVAEGAYNERSSLVVQATAGEKSFN
ncbi:MAG: universal stress protein, partial [Haloferacaceae archaeon]